MLVMLLLRSLSQFYVFFVFWSFRSHVCCNIVHACLLANVMLVAMLLAVCRIIVAQLCWLETIIT